MPKSANTCTTKTNTHIFLGILLGILFQFPQNVLAQRNPFIGAGNSYINISKKSSGGFVQMGDTLEIRTNYFFGNGYNSNNLYSVRYFDSIPLKTSMCIGGVDGFIRLITNEGIISRQYSLAGNDDPGTYIASPPVGQYQVRLNIGSGTGLPNAANPGLLTDFTGSGNVAIGTYRPRLFGGCLITTAFRVKVSGNAGDTIVLASAKFTFKKTVAGADTTITLTPFKILISPSVASNLCGNALGNNLSSEYNGTFDSGTVINRAAAPAFLIPSYDYKNMSRTVSISDGSYAVVNNSSPVGSINVNARMQPSCTSPAIIPVTDSCVNRMHGGYWDIQGDHTGTYNSAGNAPKAPGTKGGYMLMVNADVVTSEAYRQLVTGLCPDTYYEFSAWVKNICKRCGIDSNSTSTYNIGVLPNLSFSIDGLDIYSSGELDSTGWQKKGFVFKTAPGQTTALISIRNNASGGGGNDWVLDDIAIGTCGPSMNMNYVPVLLGCRNGTLVQLSDTVKYTYNPDYSWYKWERSTDGGATWGAPPISTTGSISPLLIGSYYQYITNYPSFMAYASDSGHLYRVIVATNNANLSSPSCSFTDGNFTMLKIIDCTSIVDANIISFTGRLQSNGNTALNWIVTSEINMLRYEIEKSSNAVSFNKTQEINARNYPGPIEYFCTDGGNISNNTYYRLKAISTNGLFKYSKIVVVNKNLSFQVQAILNPFNTKISADIILPEAGIVNMKLYDNFGKLVAKESRRLDKGLNNVIYNGFLNLESGMYFLSFEKNGYFIQKKITKTS